MTDPYKNDLKDAFEQILTCLEAYDLFLHEDNIREINELISSRTPLHVANFESTKFMMFKADCPICGMQIFDRIKFCPYCGQKLKW